MTKEPLTATELQEWLTRAKVSGKPSGMSVSCPTCWLPISLNGMTGGNVCPCGTVATPEELKRAFGVGALSCSSQSIQVVD